MPTNTLREYLFVYGTLMRAYSNPFSKLLSQQATFITSGSAPGLLYHVDWYPGAVFINHGRSQIWGEIYQLHKPNLLLKELDAYEGVEGKVGEYLRLKTEVLTETGDRLNCWTYQYNWPVGTLQLIPDGKFSPKN